MAAAPSWAVSHAEGRVMLSIRGAFTPAIYEFANHRMQSLHGRCTIRQPPPVLTRGLTIWSDTVA